MSNPTYTATWRDTGKTVYASVPPGNRFGLLPLGAMPKVFPGDVADEWDGAIFGLEGREIEVRRDRPEDPKDIIIRTLAAEVAELADTLAAIQGPGGMIFAEKVAAARALLARLEARP